VRSPVSRAARWAGALVLAVIVTIAVFSSGNAPAAGDVTASGQPGTTQTEFGPLTPSDVDLLVKVRQAGLWETPTGQQMQQRATNSVVQEVGRRISTEHIELDAIVRQAADQLGVTLPSQPSAQQQGWMQEISARTGADYDRTAINLLRQAHGKVLPVIAQVRSGTRNELVREFATTSATFVTRHHEYLESTGLVDFAALPEPPAPAAAPVPAASAAGSGGSAPVLTASGGQEGGTFGGALAAVRDASLSSWLAAALAFVAVLGGGALLDMLLRDRSRPRPAGPGGAGPGGTYAPPQPFPGPQPRPPAPPRNHPARPRPAGPHRPGGPATFGLLVIGVLTLPPALEGAVSPSPAPSGSAAVAAGFAALEPAPDRVLALVAATEDEPADGNGRNNNGENNGGNEGGDNNAGGDGGDAAEGNDAREALNQALAARQADQQAGQGQNDGQGRNEDNQNQNENDNQDQNNSEDQNNNEENQNDEQGQNNDENQNEAAAEEFPGREDAAPPAIDDFADIGEVNQIVSEPTPDGNASTGSFVSECGTPDPALRNSDNWIVAPGTVNGAQHMHDYIGSTATDASTDAGDLLVSETTCELDNRSTFFWPVLRDTSQVGPDDNDDGGGLDGNVGEIIEPAQVVMQFLGNPTGPVSPMPQLLRVITGDAKAVTNGADNVQAQWTCRGFEDRATTQYPLCPDGSRLLRVLDFPSCWDGENLDSEDHRSHMAFADEETGACPQDTVAVPQLRMILAYDQPGGRNFALDGFPDQQHHPATDHGDFVNGMPDELMDAVVECLNEGLQC
jgi:predicted outer membrane protein